MKWIILGLLLIVACAPDPCAGDATCTITHAIANEDPGLCKHVANDLRTWCFTDVAVGLQDSTVCANIFDQDEIGFCVSEVAVATDDVDLCTAVEYDSARDSCLFALAEARTDPVLCAGIGQTEYHDDCLYDLARAGLHVDACDLITDSGKEERCFMFNAAELGDWEVCDRIQTDKRDWCVANVAIKQIDFLICDEIKDTAMFSLCRIGVQERIDQQ